jgi:chloramphenicol 3-O-phosphotransferase
VKVQIVVISGKQGAGKTTTSDALKKLLHSTMTSVYPMAFATHIYAMHNFCRTYLNSLGIATPSLVKVKDGPLLQFLGTEWGRKTYGDSIWIDCARGEMEKEKRLAEKAGYKRLIFVFSDARFENEFSAFPEALRVRLECPREARKIRCEMWRDNEMHPSEIGLDEHVHAGKFDMIFDTMNSSPVHCATMIAAQLDKDTWLEKRASRGIFTEQP